MTEQDLFEYLRDNLYIKLESYYFGQVKATLLLRAPDFASTVEIDSDYVYIKEEEEQDV